jgi:hypothetical protein
MTSTFYGAFTPAASVFEPDDTVTFLSGAFHVPPVAEAATRRIVPPFRRPNAVGEARVRIPRTIGIVDEPLTTDSLPPFAAYAARREAMPYEGRHRLTLFARLLRSLGRGRRDGA